MRTALAAALVVALAGCEPPPLEEPDELPEAPCGRVDLLQAPPPRDEPGVGWLAPIDLDQLSVAAVIDMPTQRLEVEATVTFAAGERDGRSVLQFLRTPETVLLDGVELAPDELTTLVISDPPRTLLLLPGTLAPCSEHVLEVAYTVSPEEVAGGPLPRLEFSPEGAWWASAQEDGEPDTSLEVWLPSNMLFDRFGIDLEVTLRDATTPHELVATGTVARTDDDSWFVEFPRRQAHGSFWVLYPDSDVDELSRPVALPDGREVRLEFRAFGGDDGVDLELSADVAEQALLEYDEQLGRYLHGDVYLAWLRSDLSVSMEYDGATLSTPGALKHEMAHSWWARGVAPVSEHHGWMDEGVALWATGAQPFLSTPVPVDTPGTRLLVGEDDWSGASLGPQHYVQGAVVFAGLADRVGLGELLAVMRDLLESEGPVAISTEELEKLLFCAFDDLYVLDMFHAKVRGLDGAASPPESGWCDGS